MKTCSRTYLKYLRFGTAGINIGYFRDVSIVTPILTLNIAQNGTPVEEINVNMALSIEYESGKNTYFRRICVYINDQDSDNPQIQQEVNDTTPGDSVKLI